MADRLRPGINCCFGYSQTVHYAEKTASLRMILLERIQAGQTKFVLFVERCVHRSKDFYRILPVSLCSLCWLVTATEEVRYLRRFPDRNMFHSCLDRNQDRTLALYSNPLQCLSSYTDC